MAGAKRIFLTSSLTGEGINKLANFISNIWFLI
jgi:ethanolamine utilization protein EutP (predicted NTPase)